jgi:hypothetical protein
LTKSDFEYGGTNVIKQMDWNDEYGKVIYLRRMIKQVRKTDDEFRWLSILPVKRNQVDKYGKKVRSYLEYKYINIKASKTPELLEQVNEIWRKHAESCIRGIERKRQKLEPRSVRRSAGRANWRNNNQSRILNIIELH